MLLVDLLSSDDEAQPPTQVRHQNHRAGGALVVADSDEEPPAHQPLLPRAPVPNAAPAAAPVAAAGATAPNGLPISGALALDVPGAHDNESRDPVESKAGTAHQTASQRVTSKERARKRKADQQAPSIGTGAPEAAAALQPQPSPALWTIRSAAVVEIRRRIAAEAPASASEHAAPLDRAVAPSPKPLSPCEAGAVAPPEPSRSAQLSTRAPMGTGVCSARGRPAQTEAEMIAAYRAAIAEHDRREREKAQKAALDSVPQSTGVQAPEAVQAAAPGSAPCASLPQASSEPARAAAPSFQAGQQHALHVAALASAGQGTQPTVQVTNAVQVGGDGEHARATDSAKRSAQVPDGSKAGHLPVPGAASAGSALDIRLQHPATPSLGAAAQANAGLAAEQASFPTPCAHTEQAGLGAAPAEQRLSLSNAAAPPHVSTARAAVNNPAAQTEEGTRTPTAAHRPKSGLLVDMSPALSSPLPDPSPVHAMGQQRARRAQPAPHPSSKPTSLGAASIGIQLADSPVSHSACRSDIAAPARKPAVSTQGSKATAGPGPRPGMALREAIAQAILAALPDSFPALHASSKELADLCTDFSNVMRTSFGDSAIWADIRALGCPASADAVTLQGIATRIAEQVLADALDDIPAVQDADCDRLQSNMICHVVRFAEGQRALPAAPPHNMSQGSSVAARSPCALAQAALQQAPMQPNTAKKPRWMRSKGECSGSTPLSVAESTSDCGFFLHAQCGSSRREACVR
jgi:hypothetical protein